MLSISLTCVPKTDTMQLSVKVEVNLRGVYCWRLFIKMIKLINLIDVI